MQKPPATTSGHDPRCIDDAITAIAENNGWTLADDPTTPARNLTPETEAEAIEWLANGNTVCWMGGEHCAPLAL